MNRRTLILEELELAPLWVRRELLQAAEPLNEPEPQAEPVAPPPVPGIDPDARHPLPPIARAANRAIAPLVEPAQMKPAPEPEPTGEENDRSRAIAAMDWPQLQDAVAQCTACPLCQSRQQAVFGVGNPQAELVVVGEAPGEEEDRQGEPFVGRAGKLLDNMLAAIHEKRGERVFIANVLKCRPPGNRNPSPEEIRLCEPFLRRQLELIGPKALLATGRFAANTLLETNAPLSALRGKVHSWRELPLVVTYHPAYLLRNLPDKDKSWSDLLLLQDALDKNNR